MTYFKFRQNFDLRYFEVEFVRNGIFQLTALFSTRTRANLPDLKLAILPAILGPDMAATVLRTPWPIFCSFCRKTSMPIKFLVLGGRVRFLGGNGGGAKCQFYFCGRGDFSEYLFKSTLSFGRDDSKSSVPNSVSSSKNSVSSFWCTKKGPNGTH